MANEYLLSNPSSHCRNSFIFPFQAFLVSLKCRVACASLFDFIIPATPSKLSSCPSRSLPFPPSPHPTCAYVETNSGQLKNLHSRVCSSPSVSLPATAKSEPACSLTTAFPDL